MQLSEEVPNNLTLTLFSVASAWEVLIFTLSIQYWGALQMAALFTNCKTERRCESNTTGQQAGVLCRKIPVYGHVEMC